MLILCRFKTDMILHIFNPEHDIALAYNRKHLTMPHAAQELRMNLGWIPAIWASDGDVVLVDDVKYALKASSRFKDIISDVLFVESADLKGLLAGCSIIDIQPWGWDLTIRTQLNEAGVSSEQLPSDLQIQRIRNLSSRALTTKVLKILRKGLDCDTCGESLLVTSEEALSKLLITGNKYVLKAPWSSSGRGIRYTEGGMQPSLVGWYKRTLAIQGGLMVEPYYRKVKDFGMEFLSQADGSVRYAGLSLFSTVNNAYVGNLLMSEQEKEEMISRYISLSLLNEIRNRVVSSFPQIIGDCYVGPFGIDMMIVAKESGEGFLLHPCVEINLRRTMGHVALSIPHDDATPNQLISICHDVNYKLKINNIENNYVLTL